MKAFILSAGEGKRLQPLTRHIAKVALPFCLKPIIHWVLDLLIPQVRAIGVNLFYKPDTVKAALSAYSKKVSIHYLPEKELLGTGGGIQHAWQTFFRDEERVLIINGDSWRDNLPWEELLQTFQEGYDGVFLVDHEVDGYSPLLRDAQGFLSLSEGEPVRYKGCFLLKTKLLEGFPPGPSSLFEDIIFPLVARGKRFYLMDDPSPFFDLGTSKRYLRATMALLASPPEAFFCQGYYWDGENRVLSHPSVALDPKADLSWCVIHRNCQILPHAHGEKMVLLPGSSLKGRMSQMILWGEKDLVVSVPTL